MKGLKLLRMTKSTKNSLFLLPDYTPYWSTRPKIPNQIKIMNNQKISQSSWLSVHKISMEEDSLYLQLVIHRNLLHLLISRSQGPAKETPTIIKDQLRKCHLVIFKSGSSQTSNEDQHEDRKPTRLSSERPKLQETKMNQDCGPSVTLESIRDDEFERDKSVLLPSRSRATTKDQIQNLLIRQRNQNLTILSEV